MFESLKKKFSRTSEKLEEELIEEAEAEDNLQEEKGTRFSSDTLVRKKGLEPSRAKCPLEPESSSSANSDISASRSI